jgi:hypothetical protein
MNVLNRLLVVLGLLVIILFALMLIVLSWAYSADTIHKLGDFVTYLNDRETNGTKIIITLAASFTALLSLAFVMLELAPHADKTVLVRDVETGTAVLSTNALGRRLEQVIMSLPMVEAARAKVRSRRRAVEVDLQVMVDPETDLAATANEISRLTQEAVTQRMSVALAAPPRLRLYYSSRPIALEPPPLHRPASRTPVHDERKGSREVRSVTGTGEGETPIVPAEPSQPAEEGGEPKV